MEDSYLERRAAIEQRCQEAGAEFPSMLLDITGDELDVVGIPIALAAAFDALSNKSTDLASFYLKETLSKLVALKIKRLVPGIEALDLQLRRDGNTSRDKRVGNGGDYYIYSHQSPHWRHALICETQNRFFVVLMRYGSRPDLYPDEETARYCPPQVYIVQSNWEKDAKQAEKYASLNDCHLPDWTNDKDPHGYVAFLRDGGVDGAIYHYGKAAYCLFTLSSFIEGLLQLQPQPQQTSPKKI